MFSRRRFLAGSSVWAAGVTAGWFGTGQSLAGVTGRAATVLEPHISFPAEPRSRLAVASWPFRASIEAPNNRWARKPQEPGMDLKDFAAMVAKRFNVRNVEPLSEHFRSTDTAYIQGFRQAVEKAGSRVINIPIGGRDSYYDTDAARRKAAVDFGKKWVDIAVALNSPSIRTHIAGARGVQPDVARAAESLTQVADYGAEKNVVINLENDDLRTEDAFFIAKVLEKANHPWLHALPDFCNSMVTGNAEFNYSAMKALFKEAYNIAHMKDSEVSDDGRVYTVDVGRTFRIAKDSGYRGYFSMEWEGKGDPYEGTERLIEESLKYLV
jgi:sugar phosphate isomerase/epimerase